MAATTEGRDKEAAHPEGAEKPGAPCVIAIAITVAVIVAPTLDNGPGRREAVTD